VSDCDRIRPLLFRIAEGEASPDEAMLVGRHVADCTTCRILLAREKRLACMLEDDLDDLPVVEGFVEAVMATLPEGPPPGSEEGSSGRRRRRWRGLKLAALFGVLAASGLTLWQQLTLPGARAGVALAAPSLEQADAVAQALAGLLRIVLVTLEALQSLTAGLSFDLPALSGGSGGLGLLALAATVLLGVGLCGATVVVLAARLLLRPARAAC
jgi:hypothetical protein